MIIDYEGSIIELDIPEHKQRPEQEAWDKLVKCLCNTPYATVEYECGDCCRKVVNVEKIIPLFFLGIVLLLPPCGECLTVKNLEKGSVFGKQFFKSLVIPIEKICSFGFSDGKPIL